MSESMPSPWIRDYLVGVAETYGAQLYNAPVSKGKKKVQLTDFLTYQENSYVWAWISDKNHKISARIAKDAIDEYKQKTHRSIIDSRLFLVFIGSYRPMFSPRPLGPNVLGNTPVSHISLEIGYVSSVGIGGHLFGDPRDLELDEKMREWVLGLRQDGGGGNTLKLRKEQEPAQKKMAPPSPPSPLPFSLYAPISQCQNTEGDESTTRSEIERPNDFKRVYLKRWRRIELDPWKLATKPATEERPDPTDSSQLLDEPGLGAASRPESCNRGPLVCPASPRTPSPAPLQQQGTPTDWSPSNRGSPVAPEGAKTVVSGSGIQQHDELDILVTPSRLPFNPEEHTAMDTAIAPDTCSPQPSTPVQRTKHSPLPRSSPPRSSQEEFTRPPIPSSQLPRSSPPPPNSSLTIPPSSLPIPMSVVRKNIQRKVPHPGAPVSRPGLINQGPVQILVPNSDTSGAGSSQSCSHSQPLSQSQPREPHPSHPLAFSPCLAEEFQPVNESTPRNTQLGASAGRASKMLAEPLPTQDNDDSQPAKSADDKHGADKADSNVGKQEGPDQTRPPAQNALKTKDLQEVGTSDTEEETDVLRLTNSTAWVKARLAALPETEDTGEGNVHVDQENSQLSTDDADAHSTLQGILSHHPPHQTTASTDTHPSPSEEETNNIHIHPSIHSPEQPVSQGSMHSLFSLPFEVEQTVCSQTLTSPTGRNEVKTQERGSLAHGSRHDSEAWKEPSFIAKHKGKGKAPDVEAPEMPSVKMGKKRQCSTLAESPVPKRAKGSSAQVLRDSSVQATTQNTRTSSLGKRHPNNQLPTSRVDVETVTSALARTFQLPKPRLANFVVDFARVDLGKQVPIPRLDLNNDIKRTLVRTGRIRTLGEQVERDGSVYILS